MNTPKKTLGDFFEREYKRLVAFVRSKIDHAADSDPYDIVQDVAFNMFDALDVSHSIENASAYVYQALRHRIIDIMRKRRPTLSLDTPVAHPLDGEEMKLADILHDLDSPDALKQLQLKEREIALREAIEKLDAPSRAVIVATEFEGHSFKDLAVKWNEPIGTLLARKSRAMKTLLQHLTPQLGRSSL